MNPVFVVRVKSISDVVELYNIKNNEVKTDNKINITENIIFFDLKICSILLP
jgi:hypothetical protein